MLGVDSSPWWDELAAVWIRAKHTVFPGRRVLLDGFQERCLLFRGEEGSNRQARYWLRTTPRGHFGLVLRCMVYHYSETFRAIAVPAGQLVQYMFRFEIFTTGAAGATGEGQLGIQVGILQ